MPLPVGLLATSAAGCLSWFGYDQLYRSRREFWKQTGVKIRDAPGMGKDVKVSVIIPAYNEEANIEKCVRAALENWSCEDLEVIVVDDMSKDATYKLAEAMVENHERGHCLKVMSAGPRPEGEVWLGKCWAVYQGSKVATGDYFVFLDADVALKPEGLERSVSAAIAEDCDLLSGDVAFSCECLAEMLIQPVMIMNLVLNCNHRAVNDDNEMVASAAGHMMIFKRSSYEAFGGHSLQGVRDHVVEDVMLGVFVKLAAKGTVRYYDFTQVAEIQMYEDTAQLVEGYSKNIYLAFNQSFLAVAGVSFLNLVAFISPVVSLAWGSSLMAAHSITLLEAAVPLLGFFYPTYTQYSIRSQLAADGRIDSALWYTHPIGALGLVVLAFTSWFKSVTGLAWTWKGRKLEMPEEESGGKEQAPPPEIDGLATSEEKKER